MKLFISALMLLSVMSTVLCQSVSADELVITKDDLELFSVKRLADIFTILPQLDIYSIDGYRYYLMDGTLFENTPNTIIVLFNGVRTNFNKIGYVNLNQFPIDMELVEEIRIKKNPSVYHGEYSSGIIIDIITRKLDEDISLLFTRSTGNEIGDPGPYSFTEYASPNVDEVGPNTFLTSSYGNESFSTALGFFSQVAPSTDQAILKRTNDFLLQNYIVNYSALFGFGSLKSDYGNHNLFSAFTQSGQPFVGTIYGADLIFLDELSIELPFQSNNFFISSGNEISLNSTDRLLIDFNLNYSLAEQSELSDDLFFNTDDIITYGKISFNSSIDRFNYLIGSSVEYQSLNSDYNEFSDSRIVPALFASSNFYSSNNLQHNIEAIVQSENSDIEFFFNIGNNLIFDHSNSLMVSLYAGNLFNNVYSPAYRISRGMEVQNQFFLDSTTQNNKAFLSSLILEYSHCPDQNISFSTGINLTSENNLNFVLNDFTFDESENTIENIQNEIYESVDGTYGEFFTGLSIRLFNSLEQYFYYRYKGYLAGDEIYEKVI